MTNNTLLKFFAPPVNGSEYVIQVRQKFYEIAEALNLALPEGSEKTVTFRKLLEAQDAALRAVSLLEE